MVMTTTPMCGAWSWRRRVANAPPLEAQIAFTMMLVRGELGPYFYRFARPGEL
jgi:hypothetical protein